MRPCARGKSGRTPRRSAVRRRPGWPHVRCSGRRTTDSSRDPRRLRSRASEEGGTTASVSDLNTWTGASTAGSSRSGRGEELPQLMHGVQRSQRVVAVVRGRRRRLVLLDRHRGALEVLEYPDVPHPAVVEAQPGIDDGDPGHLVPGGGAQGDRSAHGQAGHEAGPGPGREVQVRGLERAVPVLPAVPGELAPVGSVSGQQRNGHRIAPATPDARPTAARSAGCP